MRSFFREEYTRRPKPDGLNYGHIDQQCAEWLERTFDEEKVLDAVRGMVGGKAPVQVVFLWHSSKIARML